ncbi:hypothetical protein DFH08DRAFT_1088903 [Mycena albidolilacea]|uniref:Uncharacterized protein n=1 Tax=Mycena albidolilacea TaxID=1033008 RepID=A0AAD6Z4V5_9AGAR|nr:hypothetical protein DFH08DRAFT_1088903 [Mycena albidolilacea]
MASPLVLHGIPIRDLWTPPQLGRLPTCVAMYFPTPSAAAVDRSPSTGLFPPHSPTHVLARPPSTYLHNIHRHRFGLPFIWWTDIHRRT